MVATGSANSQMTLEQLMALEPEIFILLDRSASMNKHWQKMEEVTLGCITVANQFDKNGITLVTFNGTAQLHDNVTGDKVESLFKEFSPAGGTDILAAFQKINERVTEVMSTGKSVLVMFFGDGEPSENPDAQKKGIRDMIISWTQKMEADDKLAIAINQVGNDAAATAFFKQLDDGLVAEGAKFDAVNSCTWEEWKDEAPSKLMLLAYND